MWGWCTPHELSTAMHRSLRPTDAGLFLLAQLLRAMRAIIENLNRSEVGRNVLDEVLRETQDEHGVDPRSKLAQTIEQRWGSLVKSINSFCEVYVEIKACYHNRGVNCSFTNDQYIQLVQVYSVFEPIQDMMKFCQAKKGFLVPYVVMKYLELMNWTLNLDGPLEIKDPHRRKVAKKEANKPSLIHNPAPILTEQEYVQHENLTATAKAVRVSLLQALQSGKRFYHRYTKKQKKH